MFPWVFLFAPWLATTPLAQPAYLVVLTDGSFFHAEKAALVDQERIRVVLPEGAWVELPLRRVERVVELQPQTPAAEPPPAQPPCTPEFAHRPLGEKVPFGEEILAAARRHNLDPRLVAAVVEVESGFNPYAVSPMGARGLMQLMPTVWLAHGILDPHEPAGNLQAGAAHLRQLLNRFGRVDWALAAYNAGAAVVEAYGGVPPFGETRAFVARVLARWCAGWGSL
ncbi:MAG: transglycosylase SLT domain-containing protein [Thermoanaerobaculum sp.]|nr:transglycosylase SLT domain-containing protein [Thermoanaerobaculum sp.]MDW7967233.1 transglycosylase SLT domain-containing protein [Thermoanaerobaculum sp.]